MFGVLEENYILNLDLRGENVCVIRGGVRIVGGGFELLIECDLFFVLVLFFGFFCELIRIFYLILRDGVVFNIILMKF